MSPQLQSPFGANYRSNVVELKSRIVKQLGPDRAERYFGLLNGLLSQKLSKVEFDKYCVKIVGRENLPLHNLLIRSILRNACQGKVPQLASRENGVSGKSSGVFAKKSSHVENALDSPQTVNPAPNIFSNGDALPPSPPKIRSGTQNRRIKERPLSEEAVRKDDDDVGLYDLKRPLPHQQGVSAEHLAKRPRVDKASPHDLSHVPSNVVEVVSLEDKEHVVGRIDVGLYDLKRPLPDQQAVSAEHLAKRPRVDKASLHVLSHVPSKVVEVASLKDKEHVDRRIDLESSRDTLQAPLCVPRFSASIGGAQRSLLSSAFTSTSSDRFSRNHDSGELCHTELLKKRMEKVAQAQGLEGVTLDCANLLNNGLDMYLKQLIRSSVELVGARIDRETIKQSISKQKPYNRTVNGVWMDNHIQSQSNNGVSEGPNELRNNYPITMQDFKVAMELKPQQLGADWPRLLETICIRSFEE